MKDALRFVTIAMFLCFGLIGMANAGDIDKRSLPLSGLSYACQVVNVSSSEITISITIIPSYGHGRQLRGHIGPDEVTGIQMQQADAAYCRVQYVGRPRDIIATFCALDEVGSCSVSIPVKRL